MENKANEHMLTNVKNPSDVTDKHFQMKILIENDVSHFEGKGLATGPGHGHAHETPSNKSSAKHSPIIHNTSPKPPTQIPQKKPSTNPQTPTASKPSPKPQPAHPAKKLH